MSRGFEPLLGELVDFDRQLTIRKCSGRLDEDLIFEVEYDPELSRDNYLQPTDPVLKQIWESQNDGEMPPDLLRSKSCETLFGLPLELYRSTCSRGQGPSVADDTWHIWLRCVERAGFDEATLADIIRAAIDHPGIEG